MSSLQWLELIRLHDLLGSIGDQWALGEALPGIFAEFKVLAEHSGTIVAVGGRQ